MADAQPSVPCDYMPLTEFRLDGFLQEANRQFFHPHGLALELRVSHTGIAELRVQDHRDDPEGVIFAERPDRLKRETVAAEYERHREPRLRMMGNVVQPLDWPPE